MKFSAVTWSLSHCERQFSDADVPQPGVALYDGWTGDKIRCWVSATILANKAAASISDSIDSDENSTATAYDSYFDSNVTPSVTSDADVGQTQYTIEEERAKRLVNQVGKVPASLFERFKIQYPSHTNDEMQFIETCSFIKSSVSETGNLHPFLWDDFVRFSIAAHNRASKDILDLPVLERHVRLLMNYNEKVAVPHYAGRVLNRNSLDDYELLHPGAATPICLQMLPTAHAVQQRYGPQELDNMLQRSISQDMEGILSGSPG